MHLFSYIRNDIRRVHVCLAVTSLVTAVCVPSFSALSIQVNGIMCYKSGHHHYHRHHLPPALLEE